VLRIIERRIDERLPVAYLTNEAWLGEYRFYVDQRVIVPRSFIAELLREQLAPWIDDPDAVLPCSTLYRLGCLAILAAHAFPACPHRRRRPLAGGARRGPAQRRRLRPRSAHSLVEGNLFAGSAEQRYDLIIANPPYVNAESMATLPAEYRREPELALASGDDGLDLTRAILAGARKHLKPTTVCWSSRSATTARQLEAAFPATPFTWLDTSAGDQYVFLLHRDESAVSRTRPEYRPIDRP
jgi:ribosomal protein L3 glutamine methyltransferase